MSFPRPHRVPSIAARTSRVLRIGTPLGCTANWDCVNEATSDGDATYISTATVGAADRYTLQDLGQGGTISQVTVTALVRTPTPCEAPPCTGSIRLLVGLPSATYTYADGPTGMNTLTSVTNAGVTTSFTYDANGNMLSKFGATKTCYEWNAANLLTKVKSVPSACTDAGSQQHARIHVRRTRAAGQGRWHVLGHVDRLDLFEHGRYLGGVPCRRPGWLDHEGCLRQRDADREGYSVQLPSCPMGANSKPTALADGTIGLPTVPGSSCSREFEGRRMAYAGSPKVM